MSIKTYKEALKYLDLFIKPVIFAKITPEQARKRDPLDRMRKLLELLGNPQDAFPSILAGGTSGKGSTAYLIAHILTTAGYKTGFTLSPHLEKINERIQTGRNQEKRGLNAIGDEEFVLLLNQTIPAIQTMEQLPIGEPSHFEILIAMAFLYFVQEKVDIAVVEVGLGGRWDATNTLHSLIYVLTNISLDHTAILGDTVEKIAREKAEIIKKSQISNLKSQINTNQQIPNNPIVITGVKQFSTKKIIEEKCRGVGAALFRMNKDFRFSIIKQGEEATIFDFISNEHKNESFFGMRLSLLGEFQVENASLAIQTVLQLRKFGFRISEKHIRQAFKTAFFPGRFEIIRITRGPVTTFPISARSTYNTLILDGAHNPEKMRVFIQSMQKLYQNKKKIFLIAFKEDKNIDSMLDYIIDVADVIIATEFSSEVYVSNQKALKISNLKSQISNKISKLKSKKEIKIYAEKKSAEALYKVFEILRRGQNDNEKWIVIVTGSLYLVGEARSFLSKRVKPAEAERFSRAHRA